jgi:hypothetical protein
MRVENPRIVGKRFKVFALDKGGKRRKIFYDCPLLKLMELEGFNRSAFLGRPLC